MSKITTAMFVFKAKNKHSGVIENIERHGTSRLNAWSALVKRSGNEWEIIWNE